MNSALVENTDDSLTVKSPPEEVGRIFLVLILRRI